MTRQTQNDPKFHVFSLKTSNTSLRGAEILLDGIEMKGIRAISIEADIQHPAIVKIEMIANLSYEGQTDAIDMRTQDNLGGEKQNG